MVHVRCARLRAGTRDRCLVAAEVIEIGCGRRDGREPHRVLVRTRRRTACASGRQGSDGARRTTREPGGRRWRTIRDCAISYEDVTVLVFSRLEKIRSDVLTRHWCGVMFIFT